MGFIVSIAGFDFRDRDRLSRQHQLVQGLLLAGKLPPHWKGTGDIAVVVAVTAACINQQQVVGLHLACILDIVQYTGIGTSGHN